MASKAPDKQRYIGEGAMRFKDRVRSPADLQKLSDFESRIYLPLLLSALLPIVVAVSNSADDSWVSVVVNIVAWVVFVVDLVVHARLIRHYLRSSVGIFDLIIVIITAPWFLIPGFGASQILVLARLARLVRLLFVSKAARRAASRLGKVGLFALGMLLFCSWMAYVAEHPTNPDFATFGDAIWWGIVTLTTVGYGDISPVSPATRTLSWVEAITGQFYLAVIVAGLVSLLLAKGKRDDTP
jgi:voltage-gated potassium channel